MTESPETEETFEIIKERTYERNGRSFILRQKNPYGLWTVHPTKGPIPQALNGTFTTYDYAIKKLEGYLNKQEFITDGKRSAQHADRV
jgi:hypothetical protein